MVPCPGIFQEGLIGNPVRIRDCARSCITLNGSESDAIEEIAE